MKGIIEIEFGNFTCAVVPGRFCTFFKTTGPEYSPVCTFSQVGDGSASRLQKNALGWTVRHPDCMAKWPPSEEEDCGVPR